MSTPNPIPTINPNTAAFSWVDPTTNVDGSPIQPGEVTGYNVGVRSNTATGSVKGTYPVITNVAGATAAKEAVSALSSVLKPDTYAAAIQTAGQVNSLWSDEIFFTIAQPQPNPPTGFTVG